jgi:hypothetical protein
MLSQPRDKQASSRISMVVFTNFPIVLIFCPANGDSMRVDMVIPTNITFDVEKRVHSYASKGEWALCGNFPGESRWVFCVWDKEPTHKEVLFTKELILRSFEFYHRHLDIPTFTVKEQL